MKNILDNPTKIKLLDKHDLKSSIDELSLQIKQTWEDVNKIKLDPKYKKIDKIIINGMGGSAIGGHIIKALYKDKLKVSLQIESNYTIPENVNKNTLVILSSYSGDTEEPLYGAKMALAKKAKILGITAGGKLEKLCQKHKIPYYLINPIHNPSGTPRMALGYSIIGQLGLLNKCGILKVTKSEINSVINYLEELKQKFGPEVNTKNNIAKQIAQKLYNKIPILVASDFLMGNIHTFANQINESAKTFACYFPIPELNHHLMEGLVHPKNNSQMLKFLFINSKLYHPRDQKRHKITQDVVKKNKVSFLEYQPSGKTKLKQSFEILLFGSYVSFYLAMLNNLNPNPTPWVDYFKKQLD